MDNKKRQNKQLEAIYLSAENKELLKNTANELGISRSSVAGICISKLKSRYERTSKEGDIVV